MNLHNDKFVKLYDLLFEDINADISFYQYFIENNNGPALEIGSGTGRLLIKYLNLNLNVSGIEPSKKMINICNLKAEKFNLHQTIHEQALENLNINEKFKTIYMPLFVFQNIIKRQDAIKALTNCYNHLLKDGQVIISTFLPWNDPTGTYDLTWRINNIKQNQDTNIILSEATTLDKIEQVQTKYLKFESFKNNSLIDSFLDTQKLRFYSRFELTMMLELAGFTNIEIYGDYTFNEADSNSFTIIFVATK